MASVHLLTSLGIIIGVTSVIAVVSIVQGLSYTVNAQFAGLGGNSLTIRSYTPFKQQLQGHQAKLRDSDLQAISRRNSTGFPTSHRSCFAQG